MKKSGSTSLAEFRAIISIAMILVLTISFPAIYDRIVPPSSGTEVIISTQGYSVQAAENSLSAKDISYAKSRSKFQNDTRMHSPRTPHTSNAGKKTDYQSRPHRSEIICHQFDPNSVSKEDLIEMGVNGYVAGNLTKYRASGGVFRKTEDLRKIYGVDSTVFASLADCMHIPAQEHNYARTQKSSALDINTADIEEWKSLPGIGDVLAARIVNFRQHLGGFYAIEQIGETYGLSEETLNLISDRLVISTEPSKIDLNSASDSDLSTHPYVTQRQADAIVNFRNHHGNFTQVEDILKVYSLSDSWFVRMRPYLSCTFGLEMPVDLVSR